MILNPITRIILQHANGYYSVVLDGTAGVVILPGAGVGAVTHNGTVHPLKAADPEAASKTDGDPLNVATALLATVTTAAPGADLTALLSNLGPTALISLPPGDYPPFHVA